MISIDPGFQIKLLRREVEDLKTIIEGLKIFSKPILTSEEAAVYAGIKKSYLDKLCSQAKIPFYQPRGKMKYFKREELDTWLLSNRKASNDEYLRRYFD